MITHFQTFHLSVSLQSDNLHDSKVFLAEILFTHIPYWACVTTDTSSVRSAVQITAAK